MSETNDPIRAAAEACQSDWINGDHAPEYLRDTIERHMRNLLDNQAKCDKCGKMAATLCPACVMAIVSEDGAPHNAD